MNESDDNDARRLIRLTHRFISEHSGITTKELAKILQTKPAIAARSARYLAWEGVVTTEDGYRESRWRLTGQAS